MLLQSSLFKQVYSATYRQDIMGLQYLICVCKHFGQILSLRWMWKGCYPLTVSCLDAGVSSTLCACRSTPAVPFVHSILSALYLFGCCFCCCCWRSFSLFSQKRSAWVRSCGYCESVKPFETQWIWFMGEINLTWLALLLSQNEGLPPSHPLSLHSPSKYSINAVHLFQLHSCAKTKCDIYFGNRLSPSQLITINTWSASTMCSNCNWCDYWWLFLFNIIIRDNL